MMQTTLMIMLLPLAAGIGLALGILLEIRGWLIDLRKAGRRRDGEVS